MKNSLLKLIIWIVIIAFAAMIIVGVQGAFEAISKLPTWVLYIIVYGGALVFFINYQYENRK